jgi:sialate O-acetylesterase
MKHLQILLALVLSLWLAPARAEVRLANTFGDHMVLQRGQKIPVWGTAEAGEKVTVILANQTRVTEAAENGKWRVLLDPIQSDEPLEMRVEGKNALTISDILVGDVWVCSGQSNMGFTVKQSRDAEKEIAGADHPQIRILHVNRIASEKPLEDVDAKWMVCSPATIGNFSAVGYFFGRHLNDTLHVPIGLIESAWGGTPAESWTDRATLESKPALAGILQDYRKLLAEYPEAKQKYDQEMTSWRATTRAAAPGGRPPPAPREPLHENNPWAPSNLYNGMILPLQPFTIRGVIWYQGESNAGRHQQYEELLSSMIEGWRRDWNQPDNRDFPFLIVQLANFVASSDPAKPSGWAELRDAQNKVAHRVPGAGLAVAIDIGESRDIHPKNKQEVGRRLGLLAEKQVYGRDVVASGPTLKAATIRDSAIVLEFENVGAGLAARGDELKGFEIAGADAAFRAPASATINGNSVMLQDPKIAEIRQVRYAWGDDPPCTLFNKDGLPAPPFRAEISP